MTNPRFLREHICQLLAQSYPNLSQGQVVAFVEGLFSLKDLNLFKNHLRDFLVQIKEFAGGEDNAKLYEADKEAEAAKATKEETERNMQIPGMIPPNADPRYVFARFVLQVDLDPFLLPFIKIRVRLLRSNSYNRFLSFRGRVCRPITFDYDFCGH